MNDRATQLNEPETPRPLTADDILNHPAFAEALQAAVERKLGEAGGAQTSAAPQGDPWAQFMHKLESLTDSLNVQKPGYQKPLTADEILSREAGRVEMFELLVEAKVSVTRMGAAAARQAGLIPHYIVGPEGYYGPSPNGPTHYPEGLEIFSCEPPCENFKALNESGAAIMRAQMQWLGEPTPDIGELIAQAAATARGEDAKPLVMTDPLHNRADGFVEVVDTAAHKVRPNKQLGTIIKETYADASAPHALGSGQPAGPVFVE